MRQSKGHLRLMASQEAPGRAGWVSPAAPGSSSSWGRRPNNKAAAAALAQKRGRRPAPS